MGAPPPATYWTGIEGRWLGTYSYDAAKPEKGLTDTRFEMQIYRGEGRTLNGTIIDLSWMGAAQISGAYDTRNIRFTKRYESRPPRGMVALPIEYRGEISPDGQAMAGEWTIEYRILLFFRYRARGRWEARRG